MDRIRNEKKQANIQSSGQGIETEAVAEADADVEGWCTTTTSDFDFKRLGWQRPAEFKDAWVEACFVLSSVGALAMADFIVDGFQVLLPALIDPLSIPPGAQIWPSSVVTMVAGSFLFPLGRLTDMYGGYLVFNGGLMWFTLWTLAAGFATDFIFLVFCRAMQGLGMAAFLPAGIALLGRFYRPGPRKNVVFALYGAACPVGFFGGVLTAGFSQEVLGQWRSFFWVGGLVTGVCCVGTVLYSPRDEGHGVPMDWPGTLTTVPAIMLLLYAAAKGTGSDMGFMTPDVVVALVMGVVFLGLAVVVETRVESPLIPVEIFRIKDMKAMLLYLLLSWGVYSMYQFYTSFYMQMVLNLSSLTTALWYAPWAVGGLLLSTLGGLVLDRIPASWLLIPSSISAIMAVLLFAIMPTEPSYWLWIFPAMIFEAASADILWTVSNVFLTTSLPRHHQGLAGAIISLTLFVGDAFFLAVGDVVEESMARAGKGARTQYKAVFWVAVVIGLAAMGINFIIRIPEASAELTVDERDELGWEDWKRNMVDARIEQAFAAGRVPSNITREYLSRNRDGEGISGIVVITLLVSAVVVSRLLTRALVVKRLGLDDGLALASLLLFIPFAITCTQMILYGSGRPFIFRKLILPDEQFDVTQSLDTISQLLYATAMILGRASGLAFYHRICALYNEFLIIIKFILCIIFLGYLAQMSLIILHCLPLTTLWEPSPREKYKCMQWIDVQGVNSAVSLLSDLLVFGVPLAMLRVLKSMDRKRKVQLSCIFFPGLVVVFISIARIALAIIWNCKSSFPYPPIR
ncbi:Drug resistance protein [Ophiocordyceps camponoti-floridani]|uniref:Drug resistance protein n=1 Tax=Ophiocordyceps camponoti-floridani TaxID=2030778 RepID=A0A8H4VB22_9HYPO|nr:Drug resistance protein [Ophiocordyceps camponoti-floridani]